MDTIRKILYALSVCAIFLLGGFCALKFSQLSGGWGFLQKELGLKEASQEKFTTESLNVPAHSENPVKGEADNGSAAISESAEEASDSAPEEAPSAEEEEQSNALMRQAATLSPVIRVEGSMAEPGLSLYCSFNKEAFDPQTTSYQVAWFKLEEDGKLTQQTPFADGSFVAGNEDISSKFFCRVTVLLQSGSSAEVSSAEITIQAESTQGS